MTAISLFKAETLHSTVCPEARLHIGIMHHAGKYRTQCLPHERTQNSMKKFMHRNTKKLCGEQNKACVYCLVKMTVTSHNMILLQIKTLRS